MQGSPRSGLMLKPSKILKNDWSRCAGNLRSRDLPTTAKMSTNFSGTYERLSLTAWFVRGCDTLLDVGQDKGRYSKL